MRFFALRFQQACGLAILLMAAGTLAGEKELSRADIARLAKPAAALVEIGNGYGSAFCIDAAGLFVTNEHVVRSVADSTAVTLVLDAGMGTQRVIKAKVVRRDKERDLALLRAEENRKFSFVELGSIEGLGELDELLVFGFPFGKVLSATGKKYPAISANVVNISSLRRNAKGKVERIQVDSSLNPGNSGGPVFDRSGKVVGVVVSGIVGAGINLAIPVTDVRQFVEEPVIVLEVPEITAKNARKWVEFRATVSVIPPAKKPDELELVLRTAEGGERRVKMRQVATGYTASVIPFPAGGGAKSVRLTVTFKDGSVTGFAEDLEVSVGDRKIRLSEVSSLRPGLKGEAVLSDGKKLSGTVAILTPVPFKIGGQRILIKLGEATEVAQAPSEAPGELTCIVVASQEGKEIGRREVAVVLGANPGAGVAAGGTGAPAGGSAVAVGGPNVPAAGLEAILEGKFDRPRRAAARRTHLRVLSTAGDYIGQGKSYAYTDAQLTVEAARGRVTVSAGGWRLNIAPPRGSLLRPGVYDDAKRYPFNDDSPGLDFSGNGRGSNRLSGKFVVWELVMRGTKVERLAIDFLQRSEVRGPPLSGSLRYNSFFE